MKILVVEDDAVIGADLVATLQDKGHHVDGPHATVDTALRAVLEFEPDIVLLDLELRDGESSWPIAALIRERNTPFVCLSAYAPNEYKLDPLFSGTPTLEKPVRPEAITDAVTGLANGYNGRARPRR